MHGICWADKNKALGNDVWAIPRNWRKMRQAGLGKGPVTNLGNNGGSNDSEKVDPSNENGKRTSDRPQDPRGEMWELTLEIRSLLESYNSALRHQAWLHTLEKPSQLAQKALRNLLYDKSGHPTILSAADSEYVTEKFENDLVALAPKTNPEVLSQFLQNQLYTLFQSKADKERANEYKVLDYFSQSRIHHTVRGLAVIFSSVWPILSIVVLYFIQSNRVRLGLIVLFTILCSVALAFLSRASNSEIIVATATYAAVQVVFVSGNISSSS